MREYNEFCDEINRRKEKLIQKKKQKKRIITTCVSMALCLSVVAAVPWDLLTQPKVGDDEPEQSSSSEHSEETENGTIGTGDPMYGAVGDNAGESFTGVAGGAPNGSHEGSFDIVPADRPTSAETQEIETEADSKVALEEEEITTQPDTAVTKPTSVETFYEQFTSTYVEDTRINFDTDTVPEISVGDEIYYEDTSIFDEETRVDIETETSVDIPVEIPDDTKEEVTFGEETEVVKSEIAYIMISDAAGNIIREGVVKNYEGFVIYLKLSEAELLYEYHVSPPPESLPYTTAPYDTVADEPVVEETYDGILEEAVDTEIAVEWFTYDENFDTADEIWIEIVSETAECDSMDIVEESTVPNETDGFVSDETKLSARERVIIIEISNDNDKWVFSCDRSDYEAIGRNLESLFELYEVNGNEKEPAPTQPTHTECGYCGEVGVEHERWFIAKVMSNGMVMPVGEGCFERVSAMDAGIWLHCSAVDGEEGKFQEGDLIRVTYNGMIMESYPVQINASEVEILK